MKHSKIFTSKVILFVLVLLLNACTQATSSPTPISATWTPIPPTKAPLLGTQLNPSPRAGSLMAYDSKSDRVIMFGGSTSFPCWTDCPLLDDTLVYDVAKNAWFQVKPPGSPEPRANAAMAYDIESDRVILYAGFVSGNIYAPQDTWAFDMNTTTWTKMKSQGPAYRFGHSLVYDSESDRMILFGGWNFDENTGLNDTWAYDFNTDTWTEMQPADNPPARNFQSMVYDSKADRVLMWGGDTGAMNDTSVWAFDFNTQTWEEKVPGSGPDSRWLHKISYDSQADRTILYGGYTGSGSEDFDYTLNSSETWAYDYNLNTWTKLNPTVNPGAISEFGQVYLPSADRLLLFGGVLDYQKMSDKSWLYDYSADTWAEVTQ